MESGLEQQETDRGESVAKFKAIADSLTIRDSSQFQNQEIDYSTKPWRKTLAERIKKGHGDIVVLIQLGAGARSDGIVSPSHLDPENLEAWLAYRLPNRIYGSTWAPIMGKVEREDLKHEFASLSELKFGEFIRLVPVLREEKEEKATAQALAPAGFLAKPYLDKDSGRIIHVAIKVYPVIPELQERDPTFVAEGDREHSQVGWFKLTELPTNQMAEGTRKAIQNALIKLAEIQK